MYISPDTFRDIDDLKDKRRSINMEIRGDTVPTSSRIYIYSTDRVSIHVSRVAFINFNGESGFPLSIFFVNNPIAHSLARNAPTPFV